MSYETVIWDVEDGVGRITLNRPDTLNAWNEQFGVDLRQVVTEDAQDESVRAIRAWSRKNCPDLLVGLSLGRDGAGLGNRELLATRLGEFFPARRIEACDANLVACHKTIAKLRGAAWAARRNLPLLVWTVDDPDDLRTWLLDGRAWMITTNYPREAAELRREIARESGA